jgi:molybdenum cofactor biosynthesis enzyme MoaA
MCHTWKHPSRPRERAPELVEKIPDNLKFINITGGEPFLRQDIDEIIAIALGKTRRLVISTNGYFTDRLLQAAERSGDKIGFRLH